MKLVIRLMFMVVVKKVSVVMMVRVRLLMCVMMLVWLVS